MSILPYVVSLLQFGASLVYMWNGEWRLATVWLGVSVANLAMAGIK